MATEQQITVGRDGIGWVRSKDGRAPWSAFDPTGDAIGTFPTREAAMSAIWHAWRANHATEAADANA